METLTLKNGESEAKVLVNVVFMHLKTLLTQKEGNDAMDGMMRGMVVYELHQVCSGKQEKVWSQPIEDLLVQLGLMQEGGAVHSSIRNIVLNSLEGEGLDLHLVDPVKRSV